MTSAFDTAFAAAVAPPLLAWMGVEATYTPVGGTAMTVTVVVSADSTDDAPRDRDRGRVRTKTLDISVPTTAEAAAGTPTGNYVADPEQMASMTLDGETYHVVKVLANGPLATLQLASKASLERTRPNYRK